MYKVEPDPICVFLKDTTVQIVKDKFFKFLFKHKIPKPGFTTITIIINMQKSVFQHKKTLDLPFKIL